VLFDYFFLPLNSTAISLLPLWDFMTCTTVTFRFFLPCFVPQPTLIGTFLIHTYYCRFYTLQTLSTKFLVYVDVNLLGKNLNTTKKNADASLVAKRKLV